MIPTIALCAVYFVGALSTARYIADSPSYDPTDRSWLTALFIGSLAWPFFWLAWAVTGAVITLLRVGG